MHIEPLYKLANALYLFADKSSSFIGPLMVGLISDVTGNIRNAFFFLAAMMWISLPLLSCVDVLQGQEDAKEYVVQQTRRQSEYVAIPYNDEDN